MMHQQIMPVVLECMGHSISYCNLTSDYFPSIFMNKDTKHCPSTHGF